MESEKFNLNEQDLVNWSKNLLRFFAPSMLIALVAFQGGTDAKVVLGMFYASVLNAVIDLGRKFLAEGK